MAAWTVSTLNDTVTQELERLPASMRAKFIKIGELIEKFGPQKVGMRIHEASGISSGRFAPVVKKASPAAFT